jgi:VWFA-related protein
MRMSRQLLCTTLLLGLAAGAQTPNPAQPSTPPASPKPQTRPAQEESVPSSGITLSTGTQLVVVDVVVEDHSGNPVHGLRLSDFAVTENKAPQTIRNFDEHTAADLTHAKLAPPMKLPPGTFTDYTPVAPDSTLNVLLLDTLNTPMKDQAYVRYQLQQYVKKANPGIRIAIFGLTSRLFMLQGFTADPEILKNVVDHKLIPRASVLLDDPTGANTDPNSLADSMSEAGATASAVADMQQFEAETASFQTQLRTRYTLDAFNQLARYLSTFSGRKNLIWFSGSFPLSIFPDPSLDDPFAIENDSSNELRETTTLLDRARVAVYPIDARGLQTVPMFDASRSGRAYARNPGRMASDISAFSATNAQEHMTMSQIADDTGGHAFYNTNGLAEAVTKAIDSGSNFYTLTYSPSNRNPKGEYRNIRVQLAGEHAGRSLRLAYRRGYYADNPSSHRVSSSILTAPVTAPANNTIAYGRAAMQRGAPTPSEILFKVRVIPASTAIEDQPAPGNQLNPSFNLKGPYRRYQVDYAALASNIALPLAADGHRHGGVEFITYVYDNDGKLLNLEGHTLSMNLEPATYGQLMKTGLGFSLQISAPAKSESFLRIAIHDITTGHMGVVEVPTETVAHLPALPPPPPTPAPTTVPAAPAAPPASAAPTASPSAPK